MRVDGVLFNRQTEVALCAIHISSYHMLFHEMAMSKQKLKCVLTMKINLQKLLSYEAAFTQRTEEISSQTFRLSLIHFITEVQTNKPTEVFHKIKSMLLPI